jgi:hypothetical protein
VKKINSFFTVFLLFFIVFQNICLVKVGLAQGKNILSQMKSGYPDWLGHKTNAKPRPKDDLLLSGGSSSSKERKKKKVKILFLPVFFLAAAAAAGHICKYEESCLRLRTDKTQFPPVNNTTKTTTTTQAAVA